MDEVLAAPVRVMVVDDHPLMRDGIAAMIACHRSLSLVAEAEDLSLIHI